MYVAMVRVDRIERAASWAVCWTAKSNVGGHSTNEYHVKLWGAETAARTHAGQMRFRGDFAHILVIPVILGLNDHVWINPSYVGECTVSDLSNGWYYQSCYANLIADEVRNVCDQRQDDVHTEAAARP